MKSEVRQRVAEACRILGAHGHEHLYLGHVSARETPGGGRIWMKPTGIGLREVEPDDLVLLDLDGELIRGSRPIHTEVPIHTEIYRRRPDVNSVVHSHPLHAAAFAATSADFEIVSQDSVPFASGFGRYDSAVLIDTRERGGAVAHALGTHSLVVLRNHGIVAAATTVEAATYLAIAFERSLEVQAIARSFGPLREISAAEISALKASFDASDERRLQTTFAYLLRRT